MKNIFAAMLVLLTLSACSADEEKKELKSPCVSAPSQGAETPCSHRIPVNNRWMS